jgi:hypothetical protein
MIPILSRGAPARRSRRLTPAPRCHLLSRDGREMEMEGSVAPVRVSQELLGAVMSFREASARRWEERQLRQALRLEAAGPCRQGRE